MKHQLKELSYQYKVACNILGGLNTLRAKAAHKGRIMSRISKLRFKIKNEIKRVSWLLWPNTGRPGNCEL